MTGGGAGRLDQVLQDAAFARTAAGGASPPQGQQLGFQASEGRLFDPYLVQVRIDELIEVIAVGLWLLGQGDQALNLGQADAEFPAVPDKRHLLHGLLGITAVAIGFPHRRR